jgi:hypothetical protein
MIDDMKNDDSPVPSALVERIRRLAWDVDFTADILVCFPEWTLQRVVEYGQWEDFEALARYLGPRRLRQVLGRIHWSVPRARSFSEVLCDDR